MPEKSSKARRKSGVGESRGKVKNESADKPGSVVDNHSSRHNVTVMLKRPTRIQREARLTDSYLVLLQVGFTLPSRVTTDAVRSYRTLSPLPTLPAVCSLLHFP